jgi:GT2 family glycosyltransferase
MRHIKKLATRIGNKGTQVTNTEIVKKETPKITIQKNVVVTERIESPNPLINILTRTSNRPNGFNRCRESIEKQTYKNIRHIVSIDNLNDEEYVKAHNVDYFFMDKEAISKENDIPDPKTGTRFIYNLYLNHLINEVKEGWIFILDDDDYFADVNSVQKMVNAIKNPTDLVLWQMKYPNGHVLPSLQELGTPPRLARISSQCFMLHSAIAKTIRWDGWKCGDFRFVQNAYKKTGEKRVIREVLVNLGGVGLGMKKDVNTSDLNMNQSPMNVYNKNEFGGIIDVFKKKFNNSDEKNIKEDKQINQILNTNTIVKKDIHIIGVGWNCSDYINDFYTSICKQIDGNFDITIHMLDDGSTDDSYNKILKIAKNDKRVISYKNDKNYGAAYSRYKIVSKIQDEAILVFVDLDDMIKPNTLRIISSVYQNNEIYCTMGKYECLSGKKPILKWYSDEIINKKEYDKVETFDAHALRTCISKFFKNIPESFFKNVNGEWYMYCTDVAYFLGVLYQCKSKNVFKIETKSYIYRDNRKNSTLGRFTKNKKNAIRDEIKSKLKNIKYKNDYSNINYI